MPENIATLAVTVEVRVRCSFWPEREVWNGVSEKGSIAITAPTFADAKRLMQEALRHHVETLLSSQSAPGLPAAA